MATEMSQFHKKTANIAIYIHDLQTSLKSGKLGAEEKATLSNELANAQQAYTHLYYSYLKTSKEENLQLSGQNKTIRGENPQPSRQNPSLEAVPQKHEGYYKEPENAKIQTKNWEKRKLNFA